MGTIENRLAGLIQALTPPAATACQECQAHLGDYVAAQLAGSDYRAQFPAIAAHLDACLDCAGAYARVYELELAAANARLPQVQPSPAPDLSFLGVAHKPAGLLRHAQDDRLVSEPPSGLAERIQSALQRTGERLTLRLTAELMALLRPPAAALALRAPADAGRYSEVLLSLSPQELPDPETPIRMEVYRDAARPDECLIEIKVAPPGRAWPELGGMHIRLKSGDNQHEAVTDAWGAVSFEGMPVTILTQTLFIDVLLSSEAA